MSSRISRFMHAERDSEMILPVIVSAMAAVAITAVLATALTPDVQLWIYVRPFAVFPFLFLAPTYAMLAIFMLVGDYMDKRAGEAYSNRRITQRTVVAGILAVAVPLLHLNVAVDYFYPYL